MSETQLRSLTLRPPANDEAIRFPFSVPTIASLGEQSLEFEAPVTFFIGENGSGKSTLLEGIALAARAITVGSIEIERDPSLNSVRRLAAQLRLSWAKKTRRGFFLRAEDFFGYAQRMQALREEMEAELRAIDANTEISDLAKAQMRMPYARSAAEMHASYKDGLDTVSHGESFFRLFQSRLVANGLYMLDEPEAPLSPMRQIGLLSLIKDLVEEKGAQFIIATHSPILMAYPGAMIYSFDEGQIQQIEYSQVEHMTVTRDFLNNPQRFLRHL